MTAKECAACVRRDSQTEWRDAAFWDFIFGRNLLRWHSGGGRTREESESLTVREAKSRWNLDIKRGPKIQQVNCKFGLAMARNLFGKSAGHCIPVSYLATLLLKLFYWNSSSWKLRVVRTSRLEILLPMMSLPTVTRAPDRAHDLLISPNTLYDVRFIVWLGIVWFLVPGLHRSHTACAAFLAGGSQCTSMALLWVI